MYRCSLPAIVHAGRDRQYMHRLGFACVRVHLEMGFVWLLNSAPRISDINWSTEEKKGMLRHLYFSCAYVYFYLESKFHIIVGKAMEKLHNLVSFTNSVSVCYDIALEIVEIALVSAGASELSDFNSSEQIPDDVIQAIKDRIKKERMEVKIIAEYEAETEVAEKVVAVENQKETKNGVENDEFKDDRDA